MILTSEFLRPDHSWVAPGESHLPWPRKGVAQHCRILLMSLKTWVLEMNLLWAVAPAKKHVPLN